MIVTDLAKQHAERCGRQEVNLEWGARPSAQNLKSRLIPENPTGGCHA